MKKFILLIFAMLLNFNFSFSQLTLSYVYTTDPPNGFLKLSLSGLKYFYYNKVSNDITYVKLYNADHSVFKTINIPAFPGRYCNKVTHISETLFNTDTLIEFISEYAYSGPFQTSAIRVCDENGTILLERDSAVATGYIGYLDLGMGGQAIFPDGNSSKLIISKSSFSGSWIYTTEIYDLPGQLTCIECNNGLVTGLAQPSGSIIERNQHQAFPNPFNDYVKIKYTLPSNAKHASIKIFDIAGKLIKTKEIDKHFDEIIITSDEINQGAYIYQIIADEKVIANDKIIKL